MVSLSISTSISVSISIWLFIYFTLVECLTIHNTELWKMLNQLIPLRQPFIRLILLWIPIHRVPTTRKGAHECGQSLFSSSGPYLSWLTPVSQKRHKTGKGIGHSKCFHYSALHFASLPCLWLSIISALSVFLHMPLSRSLRQEVNITCNIHPVLWELVEGWRGQENESSGCWEDGELICIHFSLCYFSTHSARRLISSVDLAIT